MIIGFFRSNNPSAIFFIPLIAGLFWLQSILGPDHAPSMEGAMPAYHFLAKHLGHSAMWQGILAAILVSAGALLLNYIVYQHEIFNKVTYMPSLLYVVLCSSLPSQTILNPILPANLCLLIALHLLLDTYKKDKANSRIFDAGLFISLASVFYFPAIVIYAIVWFGLIILRPFFWREWLVSLLGLLVPYWVMFVLYFWNDNLGYFWGDIFLKQYKIYTPDVRHYVFSYFYTSIIGLIALFSFGRFISGFGSNTIKARKTLFVLIWFFIFAILSLFLAPQLNPRYFLLLAIPGAVYLSNFFISSRLLWFSEILFWMLLGTIVYARIFG